MKKFKPNYSFADLWKQFVLFTKNWRRKPTGELVNRDTLELTGDVKCFENIVDKEGNKRFVEGDITMSTIAGFTQTYGKWSLSGSHLMIVICGTIAANTTLPDNTDIAYLTDIPKWIFDKIVPGSHSAGKFVTAEQVDFFNTSYTSVKKYITLFKDATKLYIGNYAGSQTINDSSIFRIQFDLLIDNGESE